MHPLQRRLVLVVGWIAAAIGAGLVATAAVSVAGGQVLDQPLRPLTAAEVAALPVAQQNDPGSRTRNVLIPDGGLPVQGSDQAETRSTDRAGTTESTVIETDPSGLEAFGPARPSFVRIASVVGGHASFLVTADGLALLWATPAPGYVAQTRSVEPESITIVFSSGLHAWLIEATLDGTGIDIVTRPAPMT